MKKIIILIITLIPFSAGIVLVLYPTISDIINSLNNRARIESYNESSMSLSDNEKEEILSKAEAYNKQIAEKYSTSDNSKEKPDYNNVLNFGDDILCYIEIPKINVNLPVYYESEDALSKGAVHLKNTSLPTGGDSTHAVISAHSAYPTQRFFNDLDELELGDMFYINILDEQLVYKVCEIKVVEPSDTSSFKVQDGKDMITLVTCTPFSINTHRLLVTGERYICQSTSDQSKTQTAEENSFPYGFVVLFVVVVTLTVVLLSKKSIRKKKKEC